MSTIQIVYASKATGDVDDALLEKILATAVKNNAVLKVTGMLLYTQGSFLQVLEGEESIVKTLLAQIKADHRHRDVNIVISSTIQEREFKNWSMGFRRLHASDASAMPGFAPFFEDGFDAANFCDQPDISLDILRALAAQLEGS